MRRVQITIEEIDRAIIADEALRRERAQDTRQPLYVPVPEYRPEPESTNDEPVQTVIVITF